MRPKMISRKTSKDRKQYYYLYKFDDKYVIYKSIHQDGITEADFREELGVFNSKQKARAKILKFLKGYENIIKT